MRSPNVEGHKLSAKAARQWTIVTIGHAGQFLTRFSSGPAAGLSVGRQCMLSS